MIPATPGPKIPENGPEPEFRPEFLRNFKPSLMGEAGGVWYKFYKFLRSQNWRQRLLAKKSIQKLDKGNCMPCRIGGNLAFALTAESG
jgi:hypothetical protein